jgi:hypothetical protein
MRRAVATTVFFVALTTYITWPQGRDLAGTVGLHGDALFSVWRLAWIAHQLARDPLALFDANIFWPEPHTLAFSDAILLPGALLAPAHWLGAPPLVVYNLFLLGTYVLCGAAMCALVRRLTDSWPAGLIAGVSFAFCTHRLEHFERLELLTSFWMPWCLMAVHRASSISSLQPSARLRQRLRRGEGPAKWLITASVLAAAQVLTGIYHGIFLLTYLTVFVPLLLWRQPRRIPAALAMTLLLPAVVLAAYSRPYLANRQRVGERPVAEVQAYSATPANFLASHSSNRLYGVATSSYGSGERFLFPGVIVVLLAMASLWPPVRGVTWVYAAGLVLAVLLTVGFNGPLYPLLYEYALPFRGLRVASRAFVLVSLSLSVLAGIGAARLLAAIARPALRAACVAALLVLSMAEYAAAVPLRPVEPPSQWHRWLASQDRRVVFEWPTAPPNRLDLNDDTLYMYYSTFHWQPLVNGYSGFYPRRYLNLLVGVERFPDEASIGYLQRYGVQVVIVHGAGPDDQRYIETVATLRARPDVRALPADPRDLQPTSVFLLGR